MKRFHVNLAVGDLPASVAFYTGVFGTRPAVSKPDYAKWMLEDPALNFSITPASGARGIRHVGLQFESGPDLEEMRGRLESNETPSFDESGAECCYARSDKTWVRDPDGIAWEMFLTHEQIDTFGSAAEDPAPAVATVATRRCCA